MPIALHHEGGDTYRVDISGQLRQSEYAQVESQLAETVKRVGAVRLLCVIDSFEGWDQGAAWSNLSFYAQHGDAIRRIAIVGNERWRAEALMFAVADLRQAPVQFFDEDNLTGARVWLAS